MRRIELAPEYEHLRDFIARIPDVMDTEGTYIYGGQRNLIKLFTAPDGTALNVKRFHRPRLINNVVYSTGLRPPKGRRAYEYPARLLALGLETPKAVAYIEERTPLGLLGHTWFVSIQCPYPHRLYELGDAPEGSYEELAVQLARYAARMHDAGVLHRDFSPGNILWDHDSEGYHFSVVDINRMYFGPVDMRRGSTSFARLWGPKRMLSIMVREYAQARGFNADDCERLLMESRRRFWKRYMRKREVEFKLEL